MKKIAFLRVVVALFVLVQAAYFVISWFVPEGVVLGGVRMVMSPKWLSPADVAALSPGRLALGVLVSAPVFVLVAYAGWRLDALLRALARGVLFAAATIGHLRAFAGAALAAMVWSVLDTLLRGLAWRHVLGDESKLNIGVSSEELLAMLVCALFFVIAGLMHEGRRLAEENEGFV